MQMQEEQQKWERRQREMSGIEDMSDTQRTHFMLRVLDEEAQEQLAKDEETAAIAAAAPKLGTDM